MTYSKALSTLLAFFFLAFSLPTSVQADYFRIYKDKDFKGSSHYVNLSSIVDGQLYSLKSTNVHDDMSSVKWQLTGTRKVTFYEHSNGTGRKYVVTGTGSDRDTHNENFKDCASSWRMEGSPSIPLAFSKTSTSSETLSFSKNGKTFPSGGHLQGVQQLDSKHLVVSGSSDDDAYFFIVKWNSTISSSEIGKVISVKIINDDFSAKDNFDDNHASGIQLTGNVLAIGTEKKKDQGSNILFYDLSNVYNPVRVGDRITRTTKTAGAIGIVRQTSNYLLVVAGWDADIVDFYTSNHTNLTSSTCDFGTPDKTWTDVSANKQNGWIDQTWGEYQGLNILRESEGQLYLVGFNRNSGGHDWADLYSLNMSASVTTMLKKIDKKHVYCKDGTSFRHSGGVYAPNPTSQITLWTTGKYIESETKLNRFD